MIMAEGKLHSSLRNGCFDRPCHSKWRHHRGHPCWAQHVPFTKEVSQADTIEKDELRGTCDTPIRGGK